MSKIILITGASSGIGEICARYAVKAGHKVALAARSTDKLDALVDEFGADQSIALTCDVTKAEEQEDMVTKAVDHFGRLDVVMDNAAPARLSAPVIVKAAIVSTIKR